MAEPCPTFLLQVPGFIGLHPWLLATLGLLAMLAVRVWENWRARKMRNRELPAESAALETGAYVQMTIDEILDPPLCPNCAGRMVLRTAVGRARFGSKFWGCQDFPKCRGTRSAKHP